MIFLAGPRQVGKTNYAKSFQVRRSKSYYLNWETSAHRRLIIQGAMAVAEYCHLNNLSDEKILIIFDEIHKYRKWKLFLKGFFDLYEDNCQIIVTGNAKLDIYCRGGDSLLGRYFPYRMHPLSTKELLDTKVKKTEISPSQNLQPEIFEQLLLRGGYPEPFSKNGSRFSNSWLRLRKQQLLQEDIRDLSQIQDLADLEFLIDLLEDEASRQLNIASIANYINVAESTLHLWIKVLCQFYYCYLVKPWCKMLDRLSVKHPKSICGIGL